MTTLKRINDFTFETSQDDHRIIILFYGGRFCLTLVDTDRIYSEHYYISEVLKNNDLVGGIGGGTSDHLTEENKKIIMRLVKFYCGAFG